jgi:hypothetical protein
MLVTISDSRNSGSGGNNMNFLVCSCISTDSSKNVGLGTIVPEQAAFRLFITAQIINQTEYA